VRISGRRCVTESAIKIRAQRCYFWDDITEHLDRLNNQITAADREKIEATIAKKVPRPSPPEYKDSARQTAKLIGWEYLTERQRAVLKDEAELRDSKGTLGAHAAEINRRREGAPLPSCSFCGKTQDQVHTLVAGRSGAFICDECVDVAAKMIAERKNVREE
jgi:hypothetical protein